MAEANPNAATLSWGPNDKHRLINTRVPRIDGPAKVTGTAIYTYDVKLPGMLYARILRSPYSRARVKSIDLKPALKIRGVVAAVPGLDNQIYYEGYPIAAVAATSWEAADDGIHAIVADLEKQPFVVKAADAIAHGAPPAIDDADVKNNLSGPNTKGQEGPVLEQLKSCDAVVEAEYITPTWAHGCLETHGVVIDYRGGDGATVYCSTQNTFAIIGDPATELGLNKSNVTGIVQYMGGGFGSKGGGVGMEGKLACQLSKQTGRPVKLMVNRMDEYLMTGNGPGSWYKFKAGATKDGVLQAMHCVQYGMGGIGNGNVAGQPYIYKAEKSYSEAYNLHTNVDASRALRAPGHPQASVAIDGLMDELADKLGMDPVEFRKRNLPANDAHHRQMAHGAKEIGWENRKAPGSDTGPIKRGYGCALGDWGGGPSSRNPYKCDATIMPDGKVIVACGKEDLGTGTRTLMAIIAAEELGLDVGDITVQIGRTDLPHTGGSGGSTSAASLSPVVKSAAYLAGRELAKRVAPLLGTTADQVKFTGKQVAGGEKSLSWKDACAAMPAGGFTAHGDFQKSLATSGTHGATFACVEVDTETGHVRPIKMVHVQDCGLPINRLAVESQINGGMISGLGMALLEGRVMDRNLGVMTNSSMMDYKIAGFMEMPELVPIIDDEDPRQAVVGVGEPPAVPTAAAMVNAICNAIGVRVRELPVTPDKIIMALSQKQNA